MGIMFKFSSEDLISQGRTTRENIHLIKDWMKNDTQQKIPIIPDELISIFLISCSNRIDETKKTIESYYKIKKMSPALFDNRDMEREDVKMVLETTAFCSVRWKEKNTSVIYCKLLDSNYKNCYMEPQLKVALMTMDSTQIENPPDDMIIVQDIKGIGLMHLTRVKLDSLRVFFNYIQEGLPFNLKAVHYVNSNFVLNKFMVIARMFMKPELNNKLHFHTGYEGLNQFIPKQYIPSDFSGNSPSMVDLLKNTLQRLTEMKNFWSAEEAMRKQCFINDS